MTTQESSLLNHIQENKNDTQSHEPVSEELLRQHGFMPINIKLVDVLYKNDNEPFLIYQEDTANKLPVNFKKTDSKTRKGNNYIGDSRFEKEGKSALDCFRFYLTENPYISNDFKKDKLLIRHRDHASDYAYIQRNHPKKIIWLVFDVDRGKNSFDAWEKAHLPQPSIIVQNPINENCHFFYRLERPVWTNSKAGAKAQNYLKCIYECYVEKLLADSNYHHSSVMCKNPLSSRWRVFDNHNNPVTLGYLAQFVILKSNFRFYTSTIDVEACQDGRNCSLFTKLRFYGYMRIKHYKRKSFQAMTQKDGSIKHYAYYENNDYQRWSDDLSEQADKINQTFQIPLPENEVQSTANSVINWIWEKYNGTDKDTQRGIMNFGETRHTNPSVAKLSDAEVRVRQSASAKRTHQVRKDKTEAAIKTAITELKMQGKRVTKAAVARITKINRTHISESFAHLF